MRPQDLLLHQTYCREFQRLVQHRFALRAATDADAPFLRALFIAVQRETVERLSDDPALLAEGALWDRQFELQSRSYRQANPHAAHYIALRGDGPARPIGQMRVDWSTDPVSGIDLSVLPSERAGAVGLHLLKAWVFACDASGKRCCLQVMPENPARRIYRRLGFVEADESSFPISMLRSARA